MIGREEAIIEGNIIGEGDRESSSGSSPVIVANKKLSAEDFA